MPVYTITDTKTGRTMDVRGDSPPTSDEAAALFAQQSAPRKRTWTDTAVDALPALGGMVGGAVGAATGIPTAGLTSLPAGMAGAALLGAGGEAAKQLINRVRGVPTPDDANAALTDISGQGAIQGALEGAGTAAMSGLEHAGTAVYRGYLKPSLSRVNLPKAVQIVQDAIANTLPVTPHGASTAEGMIDALHGKVTALLSQVTGKTVDLSEIADGVREWAGRTFNRPGRDPADYQAALKVADRIDRHPSTPINPFDPSQPLTATPLAANQLKQDLQTAVGDKFGVPGGSATTATEKYASSQVRQGIEQQVPSVGPLNARQSRLIDVAEALNRAVGREGNQSATNGVKTLSAVSLGSLDYAAGDTPIKAAVASLGARLALSPAVMTRAAILATKMGQTLPGTAVADVARVALQVASENDQQVIGKQ